MQTAQGEDAERVKVDLKNVLPSYRAVRSRFDIVTIPPLRYLMIDGQGDPNTSAAYRAALETLYPVAYALKFLSRNELDRDYTVMPLEGRWWADDPTHFTSRRDKSRWSWTLLNLVPEWLSDDHVAQARQRAAAKGVAAERVRVAVLDEGLCVQTLHVGPYDDEAPVLAAMHDRFIPDHGLRMTGVHHEVYLNDPRRTAPQKLRTILRQPVEPA